MAIFETVLKSDLKKPVQVKQLSGNLFSGDNQGNKITVEVMDNGSPATISGIVTGYVIREDNSTVTISNGTLTDNKASIVLPASVYTVVGRVSIVVKVGTTTVGACTAYVYRTTTGTIVDPGSVIPDISELLALIGECEAATTAATSAATAAGYVNISMNKSGNVITVTTTNSSNQTTSKTLTEPTLTVSESNGVVTVTATDANGTTTVTFNAVTLDDTAGLGDTDRVWSADKLTKEFSQKANKDGEYESLTAGSALQLLGQYTDENVPYVFRKTPVNSKRVMEKLVGGTIAWNQRAGSSVARGMTTDGVAITYNGNSKWTITQTATRGINLWLDKYTTVANHKLLIIGTNSNDMRVYINTTSFNNYGIVNAVNGENIFGIGIVSGTTYNETFTLQLFDLTQMFGSTISDAIYAMETATPGSGVAWFRSLFPKDYYAYNAGELMSVQAASKVTTGFNQWDEEWDNGYYSSSNGTFHSDSRFLASKNKIKVIPGSDYYFKCPANIEVFGYDVNENYLRKIRSTVQNGTQTIPSDVYFITFNSVAQNTITTYNNDICVNISNPAKNGTYEPYEAPHTYPFDPDLVLRGIPKWDSTSGKMYYDGDEYTADGKVTRKYGVVDLGSLSYLRVTSYANPFFVTSIIDRKKGSTDIGICSIYSIYPSSGSSTYGANGKNKTLCFEYDATSVRIFIRDDSYTDAATFKTAMSGIYLVYELATPTTETADQYQEVQICDGNGTEEFVDGGNRDVSVPVGHESKYSADIWQIIADLQAAIIALQS